MAPWTTGPGVIAVNIYPKELMEECVKISQTGVCLKLTIVPINKDEIILNVRSILKLIK